MYYGKKGNTFRANLLVMRLLYSKAQPFLTSWPFLLFCFHEQQKENCVPLKTIASGSNRSNYYYAMFIICEIMGAKDNRKHTSSQNKSNYMFISNFTHQKIILNKWFNAALLPSMELIYSLRIFHTSLLH